MEININDIVARINKILETKHETKKALALSIGFSSHQFVDWTYNNQMPSAERMYKIAKHLGVSVEYLMEGKEVFPDDVAVACSYLMGIDEEKRLPIIAMIKSQYDLYNPTK